MDKGSYKVEAYCFNCWEKQWWIIPKGVKYVDWKEQGKLVCPNCGVVSEKDSPNPDLTHAADWQKQWTTI